MKCLDSDLLIAILRGSKDVESIAQELDQESGISTTSVNAYEILFGAKNSLHKEENVYETRKLLAKLTILNMDFEAAEKASEIYAKLTKEGNIIDLRDVFIASIALSQGAKLVTRNVKDFERIKGLEIEKW